VVCFQFFQRERVRGVGQCLLALGFVFLAMRLIGEGAAGLAAAPETRQLSALLEGHPWLVAIAVTGLAVLLQSSTAAIGLGIGLVAGGVLSGGLIVPWILGTNLGLAVTTLAAGWPAPEGRKLGAANLLIKVAAAALLLSFPLWSERLLDALPGEELRRIAIFHTGYNLVAALAALPFLGPITRFTALLLGGGAPGEIPPRPTTHLDPRALESPPLALVHATRETLRMADEAKSMLENYWRAETAPAAELLRAVQRQDDQIDQHHREIRDYLSRIRETATAADTRWSFTLLGFTNELEAVGDIIDKNLCDALLKRLADQTQLTPEDREALDQLYRKIDARLSDTISLLATRDPAQARALLAGKEEIGEWCRRQQTAHYLRLRHGGPDTLASSTYFLDVLNSFKRINSHLSTLAYAFVPATAAGGATPAARRKAKP
jgi:phosphate:Na+ symporter